MYRQAARRRIARKNNVDYLSNEELEVVKQRFNHKCFKCDNDTALEIDHHLPLVDGYGLNIKNAVLLCRSCNARKGSRHPNKFYSCDQLVAISKLLS